MALRSMDVFEDVETVLPVAEGEVFGDVAVAENFPEVPPELLDQEEWHLLWRAPFQHKEPVHFLECRSILATMKHITRDSRGHGKRVLVLNDNMGVVLALMKGRCASFSLLRLLRRTWAHSLACGVTLVTRWVASELNVADRDSRAWEVGPKRAFEAPAKEEGGSTHVGGGQKGEPTVPESSSFGRGGEDHSEPQQVPPSGATGTSGRANRSSRCPESRARARRENMARR